VSKGSYSGMSLNMVKRYRETLARGTGKRRASVADDSNGAVLTWMRAFQTRQAAHRRRATAH
jgi:hypothetical protein